MTIRTNASSAKIDLKTLWQVNRHRQTVGQAEMTELQKSTLDRLALDRLANRHWTFERTSGPSWNSTVVVLVADIKIWTAPRKPVCDIVPSTVASWPHLRMYMRARFLVAAYATPHSHPLIHCPLSRSETMIQAFGRRQSFVQIMSHCERPSKRPKAGRTSACRIKL